MITLLDKQGKAMQEQDKIMERIEEFYSGIPKTWKEANMVIFFKKGNRKDIKNYRPICLLSNMYKLFTQIITTRLEKKLDENQPREQAGFRSKYSTTDHIHAINQLKKTCREYNIPLWCVAFVDYEKAFDSVQTQAILT